MNISLKQQNSAQPGNIFRGRKGPTWCITYQRMRCCSTETTSAWCPWSAESMVQFYGKSLPCGPAESHRTAGTKCLRDPRRAPQTAWTPHQNKGKIKKWIRGIMFAFWWKNATRGFVTTSTLNMWQLVANCVSITSHSQYRTAAWACQSFPEHKAGKLAHIFPPWTGLCWSGPNNPHS